MESCRQHLFVDQPVVLIWGKQIPVVGLEGSACGSDSLISE